MSGSVNVIRAGGGFGAPSTRTTRRVFSSTAGCPETATPCGRPRPSPRRIRSKRGMPIRRKKEEREDSSSEREEKRKKGKTRDGRILLRTPRAGRTRIAPPRPARRGDPVDVFRGDRDLAQERVEGGLVVPIGWPSGTQRSSPKKTWTFPNSPSKKSPAPPGADSTARGVVPPEREQEKSSSFRDRLRRELHEEEHGGVRDVVSRRERADFAHGRRQRLPSPARSATAASGPHVPAS